MGKSKNYGLFSYARFTSLSKFRLHILPLSRFLRVSTFTALRKHKNRGGGGGGGGIL